MLCPAAALPMDAVYDNNLLRICGSALARAARAHLSRPMTAAGGTTPNRGTDCAAALERSPSWREVVVGPRRAGARQALLLEDHSLGARQRSSWHRRGASEAAT
jgi:hypothetical protein